MFTGIIEEKGSVRALRSLKNLYVLDVTAPKISRTIQPGESLAVNGVCLTLTKKRGTTMSFDIMQQSIACTTLKFLKTGDRVNLEQALQATSRFGGHFVTGHVDSVGAIKAVLKKKNYVEFKVAIAKFLRRYIVPKGSICIDGISLTVGAVRADDFSVFMIPFTMNATTMSQKKVGDLVNVETDILAKYFVNGK